MFQERSECIGSRIGTAEVIDPNHSNLAESLLDFKVGRTAFLMEQGPVELAEIAIADLRGFIGKSNGNLSLRGPEQFQDGTWVIVRSVRSTIEPDRKLHFLINPTAKPKEEFCKITPRGEPLVLSTPRPLVVSVLKWP